MLNNNSKLMDTCDEIVDAINNMTESYIYLTPRNKIAKNNDLVVIYNEVVRKLDDARYININDPEAFIYQDKIIIIEPIYYYSEDDDEDGVYKISVYPQ
jgi:hypothetical protein